MNAFNVLSSRRTSGMAGANPISFTEIVAYLTVYHWFDPDLFVRYVIALDNTFLKYQYDKYEHNRKHTNRSKQPNR